MASRRRIRNGGASAGGGGGTTVEGGEIAFTPATNDLPEIGLTPSVDALGAEVNPVIGLSPDVSGSSITGIIDGPTLNVIPSVSALDPSFTGPSLGLSPTILGDLTGTPDTTGLGLSPSTTMVFTQEFEVGTTTWTCPSGTTSVTVELIGAGGGGGTIGIGSTFGGGGGGGGAYASSVVSVTAGNNYDVVIGAGGVLANGADSTFNATTVVAKAGLVGGTGSLGSGGGPGGAGGSAASSTGTTKFSGAAGATGGAEVGGVGGGSAGSGGAGSGQTAGGGTFPGGNGGNAQTIGNVPGGGGGGRSNALGAEGDGAAGKGRLTWTRSAP